MRRPILPALALLAALLVAAGCGTATRSTSPASATPRTAIETPAGAIAPDCARPGVGFGDAGFFPLALGDTWHYVAQDAFFTPDSTGAFTVPSDSIAGGFTDTMADTFTVGGFVYTQLSRQPDSPDGFGSWIVYRQDRAGLYELAGRRPGPQSRAGLGRVTPPSPWRLGAPAPAGVRAATWAALAARRERVLGLLHGPAGAQPGEIVRLAYPLRPGARWLVSADSIVSARVEGLVVRRTRAGAFAAWAIRYESTLFGPNDVVRAFYGREGYLGLDATLYMEQVDDNGNLVDALLDHRVETPDHIALGDRGRHFGGGHERFAGMPH